MRRMAMLAALLLLVRLGLLAFGLSTLPAEQAGFGLGNDARRFHDIAAAEGTPYRDYAVEVPPLSLGLIEILDDGSSRDLAVRLAWLMFACDLTVAVVMARSWGERAAFAYWALGTPLALFMYFRLDLVSVLLAVGAVAAVRGRRQVAGGLALAAGFFTKIWPVVLVPLLAIERGRRAVRVAVASIAVGTTAWIAWVGMTGPRQVATSRGAEGWEVESLVGFVLWRTGSEATREGGALRVGTVPGAVRWLLLGLAAAGIVWAWWRTRDDPARAEGFGSVVAIGSLLLTSTLLSHQYVLWLLPWVAITADRRVQLWMGIAAVSASVVVLYTAVAGNEAFFVQMSALGLRNVALVVTVVLAAVRLASRTPTLAPASEPS